MSTTGEPSRALTDPPFQRVVTSPEELRTLYREPHDLVRRKKIDHLDDGCVATIAASTLVMVATSDERGNTEVSPRGGPPGFVQVLDPTHLALPDLSGNNLLDSLQNLLSNPHIGLLFVLPGRDETLRVRGRAWVVLDDEVLDGFTQELRRPKAAIGVEVEQAFVHCAKSFRRAGAWDPTSWPAEDAAPSAAELLTEHLALDATAEQLAADLEAGYRHDLEQERRQPSDG